MYLGAHHISICEVDAILGSLGRLLTSLSMAGRTTIDQHGRYDRQLMLESKQGASYRFTEFLGERCNKTMFGALGITAYLPFAPLPLRASFFLDKINAHKHKGRNHRRTRSPLHSSSDRCTYHIAQTRPACNADGASRRPRFPVITSSHLSFPCTASQNLYINIPSSLSFTENLCTHIAFSSIAHTIAAHNGTQDPPCPPRPRSAQPVHRQQQVSRPPTHPAWQAAVHRATENLSAPSRHRTHCLIAHKKDALHLFAQL